MPRTGRIHPRHRPEELRRPPRHGAVRLDLFDPAVGHECVQVKPHGVGMHTDPVGEIGDAQRAVRPPQGLQNLAAPPSGAPIPVSPIRHVPQPPCGSKLATSGVSAPTAPSLLAPPGDPSGLSRPDRTSEKNTALSARYGSKTPGRSSS